MDKWLRNPNVVRIIALTLGILLWVVVHLDEQQSKPAPLVSDTNTSNEIEDVSIETIGLDETKFLLVSIEPTNVRVRVRGSSSAIKKINLETSKVRLDLSTVKSGDQAIKLSHVGFPSGLNVEIIPTSVIVRIEAKLKKEMPVEPDVKGSPKQGYVAGTPIIQPNRVIVTIPESKKEFVQTIRGEIDISNAATTVSKLIKLTAYDKNGAKVDVEIVPSVVNIEVPITEPSKVMTLQVQLIGTPADGFSLVKTEQNPQEVTVYGKQALLDQLEFYDGSQIDVTGLSADTTITLDIPLHTDVSRVEPSQVEVKLTIVPSERKTFEQMQVEITGLGAQNKAEFIDPPGGKLDVMVEGAPAVVSGMKAEDIDAMIDITNLPVGKHEVPIVYSFPSFVKIVPGAKETVTVEIKEAGVENVQ
ncbi:MAG: CdaR family protein [Paenibacillaceae bacterium]